MRQKDISTLVVSFVFSACSADFCSAGWLDNIINSNIMNYLGSNPETSVWESVSFVGSRGLLIWPDLFSPASTSMRSSIILNF